MVAAGAHAQAGASILFYLILSYLLGGSLAAQHLLTSPQVKIVCVEVHGSRQIGHCCLILGVQFAHTQT